MENRLALGMVLALPSCGDALPNHGSSGGGTASSGAATSSRATASSTTTENADSTGAEPATCDVFANDCAAGTKCMAFGDDEGWHGAACMPLDPRAVGLGAPCTVVDHPRSGVDNCGPRATCWFVEPDTLAGECVAMCDDDTVDPGCDLPCGSLCTIATTFAPPLCLPGCDPLVQDCPAGRSCVAADTQFVCVRDDSGSAGATGESCDSIAGCDPGHFCLSASAWPDCPGPGGCCAPACDLEAGDNCEGVADRVTCQPWYGRGSAPASTRCTPFERIGVCAAG